MTSPSDLSFSELLRATTETLAGAGIATKVLATGFYGYHAPSSALTPLHFGLPD